MKTPEPNLISDGMALARSGLIHRVWEPSSDGHHPTVVMVHGRSGTQDVMWVFARALPPEWLVVAPRAPFSDPQGGFSWHIGAESDWPTHVDLEAGVAALEGFCAALPGLYGSDPGRLYLMGFSQGAAVCWAMAMRKSAKVRGVAGLVGFVAQTSEVAPPTLPDLPVLMAVGRHDATIPLSRAEADAYRLIQAGAHLDYRAYDTGHRLNRDGVRDLSAWWRAQAQREGD